MARTFSLEEVYLPADLHGVVENFILRRQPSFIGPILQVDELTNFPLQSVANWTMAMCVRSLTDRFDDKPFHICVSASPALNAVVADLGNFHCMIVGERLCSLVVQLIGGLARSGPLQHFLADGTSPSEPDGPARCSREEAIQQVLRLEPILDEATGAAIAPLTMLAMYFLAAHEVGHVALGHLESRLSQGGMISEGDIAEEGSLVESRALEWDADGFAAAATVWFTGASPQLPELSALFPDMGSGLRHFAVASYIFFSAMDLLDQRDKVPAKRTHPEPLVRATLAVAILAQACDGWGATSAEEVHKIATASFRAAEIALCDLAIAS